MHVVRVVVDLHALLVLDADFDICSLVTLPRQIKVLGLPEVGGFRKLVGLLNRTISSSFVVITEGLRVG